jgi:Tol biopolymer transport system component/C-terminal processing protease CtpA/Prc
MFCRACCLALLLFLCDIPAIVAGMDDQWMRYPAISPDGSQICFSFQGDLWIVPATGGISRQLTRHEAYDFAPVWSPDSKTIAFASDRFGNFDVFIIDAQGGNPRRITVHSADEIPTCFSPDGAAVLISAHRMDSRRNIQFPSRNLTELYAVPLNGAQPRMLLTTPAEMAIYHPSGNSILYQDQKGYEDEWRKHHTSSITRDIWMADLQTGKHTQLTSFAGEDRNPVYSTDGKECYFLSERSGSFNVWKFSVSDPASVKQVTTFSRHPVRFLSMARSGLLCFGFHGSIYTLDMNAPAPRPVSVQINTDNSNNELRYKILTNGATETAISPNGKEIAFVIRGEVFVTAIDYEITKRITNTPGQERSISFSPDGRSLLYAGERDGSWNIYQTTLARKEEPYFYNSTLLREEVLVNTPAEEFQPSYSPAGDEIAYLENRVVLRVFNLTTKKSRLILDSTHNYSYSDGDQWYEWSPDGHWFLVSMIDKLRWVDETGLIDAQGKGPVINLSQSGYGEGNQRWSKKGNLFTFISDRAGLRSHGSWGAQNDVYATFLTQDAFDKFRMTRDEYELMKMKDNSEKFNPEEQKKRDSLEMERAKGNIKPKVIEPIKIEMEGMEDRTVRLTIHSSDLSDFVLSPDGDRLYYMSRFEKGYDIWVQKFREKETKLLAKMGTGPGALMSSPDGRHLYVISNGMISRIDTSNGQQKNIPFRAEMMLNTAGEREYMFEHAWRQVLRKFYVADLHGVDWTFYKKEYQKFLPSVNNNYDFTELLSEMLGELNASHTGSGYRTPYPDEIRDQTAALGAFFDDKYAGNGLKIEEIIEKSPLDKAGLNIKTGMIIESIDGEIVQKDSDPARLLNRKAGKPVLLGIIDPATNKKAEYIVKPISSGEQEELLYHRWVKMCRKTVDSLSGGQIGYVHVRGMNSESFRIAYSEILGRHADKKGIIVDTRFNGGGWLHDDLATLLSGKQYVRLVPRGQMIGSEPQNKWQKKSAVLMSEGNYSDAHFFPWTYKTLGIGKLIGMPVAGTATAVWWETQIDPTVYFGIPQVGTIGNDGRYLENQQLEPDILVRNSPEDCAAGIDRQLQEAVRELLKP